jgi:hypothetical protein
MQLDIYNLNNTSEIFLYLIIRGFIILSNHQDYVAYRYIQHLKRILIYLLILNILSFWVQ